MMFHWRKLYNWISSSYKKFIIGNNVVIQDGCKIGLKGFGFIPLKEKILDFLILEKYIKR